MTLKLFRIILKMVLCEVRFIKSFVKNETNKQIKLTPEEKVRQLYLYRLIHHYDYSLSDIEVETVVNFGREKKGLTSLLIKRVSLILL